MPPVILGLRMNLRVAVDLRRRGVQQPGPATLGEAEHVDHADRGGLDRLDRVELVSDRRSGTRQVVDLFGIAKQRLDDVVTDQLEPRVVDEPGNVLLTTTEEIVDADHVVAPLDQPVTEVTAEEPSPTGDENHGHRGGVSWGKLGRRSISTVGQNQPSRQYGTPQGSRLSRTQRSAPTNQATVLSSPSRKSTSGHQPSRPAAAEGSIRL